MEKSKGGRLLAVSSQVWEQWVSFFKFFLYQSSHLNTCVFSISIALISTNIMFINEFYVIIPPDVVHMKLKNRIANPLKILKTSLTGNML